MFNFDYVVGMRTAPLVMGTAAASEVSRMYAEKGRQHSPAMAGTLSSRQHELTNKRGMVPRQLLLICCPDDIGLHSPQHDTDVYAGIGGMCQKRR